MVKRYSPKFPTKLLQFDENAPPVKQQQWQVACDHEKYRKEQRGIFRLGYRCEPVRINVAVHTSLPASIIHVKIRARNGKQNRKYERGNRVASEHQKRLRP